MSQGYAPRFLDELATDDWTFVVMADRHRLSGEPWVAFVISPDDRAVSDNLLRHFRSPDRLEAETAIEMLGKVAGAGGNPVVAMRRAVDAMDREHRRIASLTVSLPGMDLE